MTFKKSGYIKIVQFELVLPVLHNFFNFWDKLTKPGNYWDYISFYNSQKFLSFWIYTFYRIEIWNRANFMIFGPFSAFGAPKEGQIFIFDKCVFYNFYSVSKDLSFELLFESLPQSWYFHSKKFFNSFRYRVCTFGQ